MVKSPVKTEPTLLESVDFRAFFETLRFRWWVIPVVLAATVGLLVAQESSMRLEPQSYLYSRSYVYPDPKAVLLLVNINPETIKEYPDAYGQLAVLGGGEVREQVSAETDTDVFIEVPSAYQVPFVFTCEAISKTDCDRALDAYVAKHEEIRRDAMAVGLVQLRDVFAGVHATTGDVTASAKAAAIDALLNRLDTKLTLIEAVEEPIGATVQVVSRQKYIFGLAAGSLLSLLILLQLTFSDSKVRSIKQLTRLVGEENVLGSLTSKRNEIRSRRSAISLLGQMGLANGRAVRFIHLRRTPSDMGPLSGLADLAGIAFSVSGPFSEMSIPDFTQQVAGEVDVIVVERNRDLRKDVLEVLAASRRSGRHLAGVLLVG